MTTMLSAQGGGTGTGTTVDPAAKQKEEDGTSGGQMRPAKKDDARKEEVKKEDQKKDSSPDTPKKDDGTRDEKGSTTRDGEDAKEKAKPAVDEAKKEEQRPARDEKKETPPDKKSEPAKRDHKSDGPSAKKREYIGVIAGYGAFVPVAAYGAKYHTAHLFSGAVPVYILTLWKFAPELHVRYAEMGSIFSQSRFNSRIGLLQMFPAIGFRYDFGPRAGKSGPFTVHARLGDGAARLAYTGIDPAASYMPVQLLPLVLSQKKTRVEFINVFHAAAGLSYNCYAGLMAGAEVSYTLVATAGAPLQGIGVLVNLGFRY